MSANNVFCSETKSAAAAATKSLITDIKDAIVSDIKDTVKASVNDIKLTNYKNQLEQKKAELAEVESSNTFFIIKIFKTVHLNSQIEDLEAKIKTLETKDSTEETTSDSEEK